MTVRNNNLVNEVTHNDTVESISNSYASERHQENLYVSDKNKHLVL